jgi:hypothetical protein
MCGHLDGCNVSTVTSYLMVNLLRASSAIGFLAIGFSVLSGSAQANVYLPGVQNLNFVDNAHTPAPGFKSPFTSVAPTGWTGGSGLIYIDTPGSADNSQEIPVYGPFPTNPPLPGNFVEADGNPDFESGFNQTITGLTPDQTYTLSFYQAGGQQTGFGSGLSTTEQWIVSLGTVGLSVHTSGGPNNPVYGATGTYSSSDPLASIVSTNLMTTPSGGVTPWQFVSINLTADSTTDLLSFLAWGDDGSTINLPPIVFLSGVNSPDVLPPVVPEPSFYGLVFVGLLGLGVAMRRRRRQNAV